MSSVITDGAHFLLSLSPSRNTWTRLRCRLLTRIRYFPPSCCCPGRARRFHKRGLFSSFVAFIPSIRPLILRAPPRSLHWRSTPELSRISGVISTCDSCPSTSSRLRKFHLRCRRIFFPFRRHQAVLARYRALYEAQIRSQYGRRWFVATTRRLRGD